ncbi:unnamed protein product [Gongylonema pulchrum]|uniref:Col_cuticle_N domain-containing protein n=1 Tax=Gongylonema pulchrum TaxID=637853 RepID=A0A183E6H3_9BILA|nr:unnamed protein product [Gongylonema pulchrum]
MLAEIPSVVSGILFIGVLASVFATGPVQEKSEGVSDLTASDLLSSSFVGKANLTLFDNSTENLSSKFTFLKYMRHPPELFKILHDMSKANFNKLKESRGNYIYLPALIGVAAAVVSLVALALLRAAFKHCRSLVHRIRVKRMCRELHDDMNLIQKKARDESIDSIPL